MTRLEGRVVADRYRIENVVSSGASTVITEAIEIETDRPVTVKIVQPELAISSHFRAAFERQISVAQSLTHPNIAAVLDSGQVEFQGETTVFWVVEYLGGGSLRDIFDRGRLLQPSQALVVGLEACRALDVAHRSGIVHTEITPSKLVFGTDGRLRIVDFAMAKLMGADAWAEPATVATHVARYASPEQALSLEVDAKTDVYALSLCLVEAITGKVPFAGDSTVSTLAGRVGKLMPVTADMGSLAAVLERGGRPDAEDRWTAAEFGAAFVQAAGTLPRPDPIPVMAASLFATSLATRQATAAATAAASAAAATAAAATAASAAAAASAQAVGPAADDETVELDADPMHEIAGTLDPDPDPTPAADHLLDPAESVDPDETVEMAEPADLAGSIDMAEPADVTEPADLAASADVGETVVEPDRPIDLGSTADADSTLDAAGAESIGADEHPETGNVLDAKGAASRDVTATGNETPEPLVLLTDVSDDPAFTRAVDDHDASASTSATTSPTTSASTSPTTSAPTSPTTPAAASPSTSPTTSAAGTSPTTSASTSTPASVSTSTPESVSTSPDTDSPRNSEMPDALAAAAVASTPPTTRLDVIDPTPSGIMYDEEKASRPWGKYLIIGLVVLIGVAALGAAGWFLLRTKSYEVPDLVDVDESVALEAIADNGWEIQTERERSDEVPEIDHVTRTEPVAGERLDEGKTFVIYLSDGYKFRDLPELDGVPVDEAVEMLDDLKLVAEELAGEYSETVPEDAVISWQVPEEPALVAGGQVLPDTVVEITPSLGPEPRPAPDLVGMTPGEATAALDALQLVYLPAEDIFSSDIEKGLVATQTPVPTTAVERGETVSVQVSKGPELVPIPDLADMTYPEAQKALADVGFVVNSLLGTTEGTFVSISVDGTRAGAGDQFAKGSGVDLIFL